MSVLSRLWKTLFHPHHSIGQASAEARTREQQLVTSNFARSLESHPDSCHLCERCKRLQLRAHVEQPWAISQSVSTRGFMVARISESSIDTSCYLCAQLVQFLHHPALVPASLLAAQTRSFELWCRHTSLFEEVTTYFYIHYYGADRELRLFPIEPTVHRGLSDGRIGLLVKAQQSDVGSAGMVSGRLCDPASIDAGLLKEWIEWCSSDHRHVCGEIGQGGIRPDRLIDCTRRQLCNNDEPYVCLSYVWGNNLLDGKGLGSTLPEVLPPTISDAMEVTLKIGLRYLWVDRYCINQEDAEEKHNIIRNMDAICKSYHSKQQPHWSSRRMTPMAVLPRPV
jgi:hypothetical protein